MLRMDFALGKKLVWIATHVTIALVCSLSIIRTFGWFNVSGYEYPYEDSLCTTHTFRYTCIQAVYLQYTELCQYMLLLPASCTKLLMSRLSQCHLYTICMLGHILYYIFCSWAFPSICRMFPWQLPLISGSGILQRGAYPDLTLPPFPCICFT